MNAKQVRLQEESAYSSKGWVGIFYSLFGGEARQKGKVTDTASEVAFIVSVTFK